jgi:phosphatidylserine/phosphatidylglycerophosphate/cardiolipin synthase-like enzyme
MSATTPPTTPRPFAPRLALSLSLASLALASACDGRSPSTSPDAAKTTVAGPSAGDPDGTIELLLHDPSGRPGPSEACEINLCRSLLELIQGAQTSIDFAVYGVRGQPEIIAALEAAKARGVRIRGVVDRDVAGKNYYRDTDEVARRLGNVRDDRKVDAALEREETKRERSNKYAAKPVCGQPEGFAGFVQCLAYDLGDRCLLAAHASRDAFGGSGDDSDGDGAGKVFNKIMHHKFFVIDGRRLWTGSTNVSDSGTGGYNSNLVVVLDSPTVAGWYTQEFERMWTDGDYHQRKPSSGKLRTKVGDAEVQVLFSPQDKAMTDGVRPVLQRAKRRIDIGVFYLTHKAITKDLLDAHRRGVEIRVILDATAAKNGYTKHELLRAAGIPVKVEVWGGKMHMKSAAVDGEWVIAGSMNWTSAGEWDNDENTLIIRDPKLASQYHAFFDQLWAGIPETWATRNPDPESRDSIYSCTDGFDNDYDGLADNADPGCSDNPPPLPELPPHWIVAKDQVTCQHPSSPR